MSCCVFIYHSTVPLFFCARGVIDKSIWDNNLISHCTCNNLIGQVSPVKHLWLCDWETWNSLSLLSLSFCSILSSLQSSSHSTEFCTSRRLERAAVGAEQRSRREGRGGGWGLGGGLLFLQGFGGLWCSFSFALSSGHFGFLIADDNYHHHYCYLHQCVRLLQACYAVHS